MKFYAPKKALTLWRIYLGIILLWAIFSCVFLAFFIPPVAVISFLIIAISICAFANFYYLPKLQDSMSIKISEEAIVYSSGVFINRRHVLPRPRMIYTEQFYTPISSAMGLRNLRLHATRGMIYIFSLDVDDAAKIINATFVENTEDSYK